MMSSSNRFFVPLSIILVVMMKFYHQQSFVEYNNNSNIAMQQQRWWWSHYFSMSTYRRLHSRNLSRLLIRQRIHLVVIVVEFSTSTAAYGVFGGDRIWKVVDGGLHFLKERMMYSDRWWMMALLLPLVPSFQPQVQWTPTCDDGAGPPPLMLLLPQVLEDAAALFFSKTSKYHPYAQDGTVR